MTTRIPQLLAALLLCTLTHGFVPSIRHVLVSLEYRQTPSFLCSMATENTSSQHQASTLAINRQLDELAKQCGDPTENPILTVCQCEDLFNGAEHVDIISFNTLLKAYAKTCASLASRKHALYTPSSSSSEKSSSSEELPSIPIYTVRDAAERATNLLLEMERAVQENPDDSPIRPDATSYNCVIDAWAKSRVNDAPQACERLLKRMIDHDTIEPDTISYNGVLDAWHASGDLERIWKIYNHMQQDYEENGNTLVKPTIRTVHSVLAAHAKHVADLKGDEALECAKSAHSLLEKMKQKYQETGDLDYQVDLTTYTSVMDAYARCGMLDATLEAEKLLQEVKDDPSLQPTTRTFTSLLTAWAKTRSYKSPHNAEALLEEMELSENAKPNTRSYTAVIQAWARSRDATKPQRALRILKKMKELAQNGDTQVRPNLITYNAAIDACARCQGTQQQQTEALKIAFAVLKSIQLEPDMDPNHVTFATVLKATAFLLPAGDERNKVASALFEKARAAGQVDMNMIKNMRKAVDNNVMQELLQDLQDKKGHVNYGNIPPAWSRNVR